MTLEGGLGASGALLVCEPPTGWNRDPRLAELGKKDEVQCSSTTRRTYFDGVVGLWGGWKKNRPSLLFAENGDDF